MRLSLLLLALWAPLATAGDAPALRLAVVPIVAQGGFIEWLLAPWLEDTGSTIEVRAMHGQGVAAAVRAGAADLAITHADFTAVASLVDSGELAAGAAVFANPIALLVPPGDPAGVATAPDLAAALARLKASDACLLLNRIGDLAGIIAARWSAIAAGPGCLLTGPAAAGAGAVSAAAEAGAYTFWGLHPWLRQGGGGYTAAVFPEAAMLRDLHAWPVTGSARAALAADLVRWLSGPVARARLGDFRLTAHADQRLWWPPLGGP